METMEAPPTGGPVPADEGRWARRSPKRNPRHARVVVRKVRPWSVLKVSLIFYTCVMAAILLALVILWGIMSSLGVVGNVERIVGKFIVGFRLDGGWLFARALGIGAAMVVVWSLINVVATLIYNLISDVVGGIEVTLSEKS